LRVGQRFVLWPSQTIGRHLHSFAPHLIHAHDVSGMGLAGLQVARSIGLPTVATAHQLPWFAAAYLPDLPGLRRLAESALWRYAGFLAARCDSLIVPTEPIAQIVRQRISASVQAISNGVGCQFGPEPAYPGEADDLAGNYGLDTRLPVVLYVGRLDQDKRVDLVVRAVASLPGSLGAQLVVAGDGTRRRALMGAAKRLGIGDRARFPGFVSAEGDLPGLYRLATVFVTLSEIETQCLTALEALASGTPVITVRTPVMEELVRDGINGFLISPGDVPALTARLGDLLAYRERAREMGRAGLRIAATHTFARTITEHETIYGSLLAEPAESPGSR
jgi:glycosyltransferase involved in cell wall biosynthesis